MVKTVVRHDYLSIHNKYRTITVLAHGSFVTTTDIITGAHFPVMPDDAIVCK